MSIPPKISKELKIFRDLPEDLEENNIHPNIQN